MTATTDLTKLTTETSEDATPLYSASMIKAKIATSTTLLDVCQVPPLALKGSFELQRVNRKTTRIILSYYQVYHNNLQTLA